MIRSILLSRVSLVGWTGKGRGRTGDAFRVWDSLSAAAARKSVSDRVRSLGGGAEGGVSGRVGGIALFRGRVEDW